MQKALAALVSGSLFGFGLALSQMVSPAKVQGFLDLAGDWDPSLAFVMGGAVLVTYAGYSLILRRPRPLFDAKFHVPTRREIDAPLIGGAALFGIGWGLIGFCPGPALAALAVVDGKIIAFVAAMLAGMAIDRAFGLIAAKSRPRAA